MFLLKIVWAVFVQMATCFLKIEKPRLETLIQVLTTSEKWRLSVIVIS